MFDRVRTALSGERSSVTHLGPDAVLHLAAIDAGAAPEGRDGDETRRALAHASACPSCRRQIEQQREGLADLSDATRDLLDRHFPPDRLERQVTSVMRRIAPGRERGRVLAFPARATGRLRPRSSSRRWVAAAAAVGMFLGVVTGRLLSLHAPDGQVVGETALQSPPARSAPPAVAGGQPRLVSAASAASEGLDDGEAFLLELDAALTSLGTPELQVLDDLTPRPTAVMASARY